jgi:Cu/Ag efflux protein CusF
MHYRIKNLLLGSSTALIAGSLLFGCASKHKPKSAEPAMAVQAVPLAESKPHGGVEELVAVTARVEVVNRKKRIITLKFPDGKTAQVKCGPEVVNFPLIQVGDDVTVRLLESVELFVIGAEGQPTVDQAAVVKRAPKGGKPGMAAAQALEITATVESIDYETRKVTLKGPEGRIMTMKAGPEIKRLRDVKPGDTVVARYTEAASIEVTVPEKTK